MKRYFVVLAVISVLMLAIGIGSASAGGLLPIPGQTGSQDQDVSNQTSQQNTAFAVSPTVAVLNNVALVNGGDQTTTAGTTQNQGNANSTDQTAIQSADQDQATGSDGHQWADGSKTDSSASGASQRSDQDQDVENSTEQENTAIAISPTIAAGNNLALVNGGDQTTTAGTSQNQGNANSTDQTAVQAADQDQKPGSDKEYGKGEAGKGKGYEHTSGPSQKLEQDQDVKNRTEQENKAIAVSPTVAVLNNLALVNGGDQTTTAGTSQYQGNANWTDQTAVQAADQDQKAGSGKEYGKGKSHDSKGTCECAKSEHSFGPSKEPGCDEHESRKPEHPSSSGQKLDQHQEVKNRTEQENKAFAFSPTVAVLNNLALVNCGDQTTTAGTSQNQGNVNWTDQKAFEATRQKGGMSH